MKRARKFGVFGIFKEQGPGWRTERYLYLAFLATLIASATFLGVWKQVALLWFVPQFSLFQAITRLRGYSEHAGRFDEASDLNKTRTVDANLIESFIFAPASINRHLEHHLYPSVPFFNLDRLHEALTEKTSEVNALPPTQGYLRLSGASRTVFGELYIQKTRRGVAAE